jgi:DNA-binding NtrC family response regulator
MQSILVVEDDYAMRRGIALMLRGEGYDVFEAEDSAMASQVMAEHPIDMAIIDLFLGEENGIHVAGSVLQHSPDAEVLIVTAHGDHKRALAARKIFKDHFLEKSALATTLLKTVEEICRSKKTSMKLHSLTNRKEQR